MGIQYDKLPKQERTVRKELNLGDEGFKKYWFHVAFGPQALFERVKFKMDEPHDVKFSNHAVERAIERGISESVISEIRKFDPHKWRLIMASVSPYSYKFVDSTWERIFEGSNVWMVMGLYATIESIYIQTKADWGMDIAVRENNELYEKVERVNSELMYKERSG